MAECILWRYLPIFLAGWVWLILSSSTRLLTWSPGWKRRYQNGSPVRPVRPVRPARQARSHPLRSPSRFPATSFSPSALLWRPGIRDTFSLDVGGRRLQCGRNFGPGDVPVSSRGTIGGSLFRFKFVFTTVIVEVDDPGNGGKERRNKQNKNSWRLYVTDAPLVIGP